MNFELFELLGFGGTGLAVTVAVVALFWNADGAISKEFREDIRDRLVRIDLDVSGVNWVDVFNRLVDWIFGPRLISLRAVLISFLVSIAFVLLFSVVLLLVVADQSGEWLTEDLLMPLIAITLIGALLNPVIDFVSLLQTRWILRINEIWSGSMLNKIAALILDFIATLAIFTIGFGIVTELFFSLLSGGINLFEDVLWVDIVDVVLAALLFGDGVPEDAIASVFLYSTLMTSIWLWLFIAGAFVIRNAARFQRGVQVLRYALPINEKPMRSIGMVAGMITALGFLVYGLFSDSAPEAVVPSTELPAVESGRATIGLARIDWLESIIAPDHVELG